MIPTEITLTLTLEETDLVLNALSELPWKQAHLTILKIKKQADSQVKPAVSLSPQSDLVSTVEAIMKDMGYGRVKPLSTEAETKAAK